MTTTFEEAWFVNQTCINLTEISLGWISSLKTSLNPFKKFFWATSKFMLRMSNFREFPRKRTWGTFCRYLAWDKISSFHILTCLPFAISSIVFCICICVFSLYLNSRIWSTIKISTFYILICLPFAISSISLWQWWGSSGSWWWWSEASFLW